MTRYLKHDQVMIFPDDICISCRIICFPLIPYLRPILLGHNLCARVYMKGEYEEFTLGSILELRLNPIELAIDFS